MARWRESRLSEWNQVHHLALIGFGSSLLTTIARRYANRRRSQYKLREKDLEGLKAHKAQYTSPSYAVFGARAEPQRHSKTNYVGICDEMQLYNELEVERRAWERYGGPEAFEAV